MKLALLIFFVCVGFGFSQERRFAERLLGIDMERVNSMQGLRFDGGEKLNVGKMYRYVNQARGVGEFRAGEYRGMRSFLGIKNPWFGREVFPVRKVTWGDGRGIRMENRVSVPRGVEVRQAVEASRRADGQRAVATKESAIRGGAQGALDTISERLKRELTVDEVREILNKNR